MGSVSEPNETERAARSEFAAEPACESEPGQSASKPETRASQTGIGASQTETRAPLTATRAPRTGTKGTGTGRESLPPKAAGNGRARSPRRAPRNPRRNGAPVYGALDLGTNNCRLLVARPSRRGFLVIDAFSRIIRLGEGVSRSGRLSNAAMDRTIQALRVCSEKMIRKGVVRSRLIATEACRIAENGSHFLTRVEEETGLKLEVVSRETEAKLAVSGCASLLDRGCDWALVFDIGGGSSELIWLDLSRTEARCARNLRHRVDAQNCIAAWTSLPVGVVTLAEQYGGRTVDRRAFEAMVTHVQALLEPFEREHALSKRTAGARRHLLGTSGTVTTVAGIHLGLAHYDRERVDGCWLMTDEVNGVSSRLLDMSYEERVAQPCIGLDRADLVLAGCAILEALMRTWPCRRLRVADRGLREGILATLMTEDGHYLPRKQNRQSRS